MNVREFCIERIVKKPEGRFAVRTDRKRAAADICLARAVGQALRFRAAECPFDLALTRLPLPGSERSATPVPVLRMAYRVEELGTLPEIPKSAPGPVENPAARASTQSVATTELLAPPNLWPLSARRTAQIIIGVALDHLVRVKWPLSPNTPTWLWQAITGAEAARMIGAPMLSVVLESQLIELAPESNLMVLLEDAIRWGRWTAIHERAYALGLIPEDEPQTMINGAFRDAFVKASFAGEITWSATADHHRGKRGV